jgi:cysteine desulfurase / selenocysteine lyase
MSIEKIRSDFPILNTRVYGKPLIYLDNAATTQKPRKVIDAISGYYSHQNSNVHRGVHYLSQQATLSFEAARKTIGQFINAPSYREVIFTRGTTESINLVACSFGELFVKEGDEILVSAMEHHSNIVPWQMLCERKNAVLKVIPIYENGEIDMAAFIDLLNNRTRMVAVNHVSNILGTINPVKEITRLAHMVNSAVLIDGAQGLSHGPVDVREIGCDFYAFSAHKMYGPMGIGGLFGKEELLKAMPPYQGGGEMIDRVTFEKTTYNELPFKFEAGTPNVADALGFAAAVEYLGELGWPFIVQQENDLLNYATEQLNGIKNLQIIGTARHKAAILSFVLPGIHFFDAGTIIDQLGIAVRTGNHCTQPLMDRLGITGTIRASFSFYNTRQEIDELVKAIHQVFEMFR